MPQRLSALAMNSAGHHSSAPCAGRSTPLWWEQTC